eukprot:scaffold2310_cov164-Amphora_coffeaeformis.AAC.11
MVFGSKNMWGSYSSSSKGPNYEDVLVTSASSGKDSIEIVIGEQDEREVDEYYHQVEEEVGIEVSREDVESLRHTSSAISTTSTACATPRFGMGYEMYQRSIAQAECHDNKNSGRQEFYSDSDEYDSDAMNSVECGPSAVSFDETKNIIYSVPSREEMAKIHKEEKNKAKMERRQAAQVKREKQQAKLELELKAREEARAAKELEEEKAAKLLEEKTAKFLEEKKKEPELLEEKLLEETNEKKLKLTAQEEEEAKLFDERKNEEEEKAAKLLVEEKTGELEIKAREEAEAAKLLEENKKEQISKEMEAKRRAKEVAKMAVAAINEQREESDEATVSENHKAGTEVSKPEMQSVPVGDDDVSATETHKEEEEAPKMVEESGNGDEVPVMTKPVEDISSPGEVIPGNTENTRQRNTDESLESQVESTTKPEETEEAKEPVKEGIEGAGNATNVVKQVVKKEESASEFTGQEPDETAVVSEKAEEKKDVDDQSSTESFGEKMSIMNDSTRENIMRARRLQRRKKQADKAKKLNEEENRLKADQEAQRLRGIMEIKRRDAEKMRALARSEIEDDDGMSTDLFSLDSVAISFFDGSVQEVYGTSAFEMQMDDSKTAPVPVSSPKSKSKKNKSASFEMESGATTMRSASVVATTTTIATTKPKKEKKGWKKLSRFGTQFTWIVIPLVSTDACQQDGITGLTLGQRFGRKGIIDGIEGCPSNESFLQVEGKATTFRQGFQDNLGGGGNFRSDTISGQQGHVVTVLASDRGEGTAAAGTAGDASGMKGDKGPNGSQRDRVSTRKAQRVRVERHYYTYHTTTYSYSSPTRSAALPYHSCRIIIDHRASLRFSFVFVPLTMNYPSLLSLLLLTLSLLLCFDGTVAWQPSRSPGRALFGRPNDGPHSNNNDVVIHQTSDSFHNKDDDTMLNRLTRGSLTCVAALTGFVCVPTTTTTTSLAFTLPHMTADAMELVQMTPKTMATATTATTASSLSSQALASTLTLADDDNNNNADAKQQQQQQQQQPETTPQNALDEAWTLINKYYIDRTFQGQDWDAVKVKYDQALQRQPDQETKLVTEMVQSLQDKYSRLLSAEQYAAIQKYDLIGVGATLMPNADKQIMVGAPPIPGSAAALAGLQVGDIVQAVNGQSTEGRTAFDIIDQIAGEDVNADTITLTIRKAGDSAAEATDYTLARAFQKVKNPIQYKITEKRPDGTVVGYVRISEFNALVKPKLEQALKDLFTNMGANALVLDLRGNGGGAFQSAVEISSLFLNQQIATYVVDGTMAEIPFASAANHVMVDTNAPLVLWMDGRTASASEVLAAALHDNCRATLAGTPSFGKGLIQAVYGLKNGDGLVLTVAKYVTPKHDEIQGIGLRPDVEGMAPGTLIPGLYTSDTSSVDFQKAMQQHLNMCVRPDPTASASTTTLTDL